VKIVDFGLAHLLEGGQGRRLTAAGSIMGSALFVAPERLQEIPADARSDIYSLGAILFEALTARPLFEGETMEAVLINKLMNPPNPPSRYRQDIAPGSAFDSIVLKATDKDPDKRYQTATELRLELEQIHSQLLLRRPSQH